MEKRYKIGNFYIILRPVDRFKLKLTASYICNVKMLFYLFDYHSIKTSSPTGLSLDSVVFELANIVFRDKNLT